MTEGKGNWAHLETARIVLCTELPDDANNNLYRAHNMIVLKQIARCEPVTYSILFKNRKTTKDRRINSFFIQNSRQIHFIKGKNSADERSMLINPAWFVFRPVQAEEPDFKDKVIDEELPYITLILLRAYNDLVREYRDTPWVEIQKKLVMTQEYLERTTDFFSLCRAIDEYLSFTKEDFMRQYPVRCANEYFEGADHLRRPTKYQDGRFATTPLAFFKGHFKDFCSKMHMIYPTLFDDTFGDSMQQKVKATFAKHGFDYHARGYQYGFCETKRRSRHVIGKLVTDKGNHNDAVLGHNFLDHRSQPNNIIYNMAMVPHAGPGKNAP